MVGVAYAKRPITVRGLVYCDTSFLLDIFSHDASTRGRKPKVLVGQAARAKRAADFRVDASSLGVVFITSIFAVEEAFHKLLSVPILKAANLAGHKDWKVFQSVEPTLFAAAVDVGRNAIVAFDLFLAMSNIDVLAMGRQPYPKPPILEAQVQKLMKMYLLKYEVEAMDALHYATMRKFSILAAASSDRGWLQFSRGTLFTDI